MTDTPEAMAIRHCAAPVLNRSRGVCPKRNGHRYKLEQSQSHHQGQDGEAFNGFDRRQTGGFKVKAYPFQPRKELFPAGWAGGDLVIY